MSGIYFSYNNYPKDLNTIKSDIQYMTNQSWNLPDDVSDHFITSRAAGAVIHHNQQRSCGIAWDQDTDSRLIIIGSCWLNEESPGLATPAEILHCIQHIDQFDQWPLYGFYTILLYNVALNLIIVQTDTFGVYPLYYRADQTDQIRIASEIKALVGLQSEKPDREGIAEFIKIGHLSTDSTFIHGVRRLPPNSRIIIDKGIISVQMCRQPEFKRNRPFSSGLMDDLSYRFKSTFDRFLPESKILSVSMSGGLDSRLCAAAAYKAGFEVKAVCMGEKGSLECKIGKKYGKIHGIDTYTHEYDGHYFAEWFPRAVWVTEGRCPPMHMHYFDGLDSGHYLPQLQLNGLLAGAIVGGDYEKKDLMLEDVSTTRDFCRSFLQPVYWPRDTMAQTVGPKLVSSMLNCEERVTENILARMEVVSGYEAYLWFRFNFRAIGLIVNCIGSQVIPWTEPVLPYLDPAFFRLCGQADQNALYDRKLQLEWACTHFPDVKVLPRVKDGALVPLDHIDLDAYNRAYKFLQRKNHWKYLLGRLSHGQINLRRSETFPYYDQWYRRWPAIRQYFDEMLLGPRSLDRGLWNREGIELLLHDLKVGRNVWNVISNILLVEVFLRQFIDGDRPAYRTLTKSIL